METPPTRRKLPEPLPVPAEDLSLRAVGREFVDLFRFMLREIRWASGQVRRELAGTYRAARNPSTSRETLKGLFRGLVRANIMYGVILIVVMPLAGAGERAWQFMVTATVVCMAIEIALAGNWLPPEKKRGQPDQDPPVVPESVPHTGGKSP